MMPDIQFTTKNGTHGNVGMITLNRPKALNALTEPMCISLHQQLMLWEDDSSIKAVVIQGAGEKAFCAGGDIRQVYDNGPDKAEESAQFFWHEYRMNKAIHHFKKPYIALLDGITMGGGCGVSMHGSHRVATERLNLAMPETGIGFFPDVGGGYFLSRLPKHIGWYLGLTGNRIKAADALASGYVNFSVSSDTLDALIAALAEKNFGDNPTVAVTDTINQFSLDMGDAPLQPYFDVIDKAFSAASVEGVLDALKSVENNACREWCETVLNTLLSKSPYSLEETFQQLMCARDLDFDAAIDREYEIAKRFLQHPDFYEGIRAAIIDKDRSPNWV